MQQVIDILNQLGNTTSRTEKELILFNNGDNQDFKRLLECTYNPFKVYGIGKKAFKKPKGQNEFNNIFELLDYLLAHNTGSDAVKDKVNAFLAAQPPEHAEWYKRVLLKELRVGVQPTTINKMYPGLIPVFTCQLASPVDGRFPQEVIVEPKLDGIRAIYIGGRLFTRKGKVLEGFKEIEEQLKRLVAFSNGDYVLDGELMAQDFTATQELAFKKAGEKTGVNFNVFDYVSLKGFKQGRDDTPLIKRKSLLEQLFEEAAPFIPNIKYVRAYYEGPYRPDRIQSVHERIVTEGYEGSMIKDMYSPYECKRTKTWLKKKDFDLHDLEVTGVFEGEGRLKGTLGGVIVDYKGYAVEVGSGFTDEQRKAFWEDPNSIVGKVIAVQAQEESKDKEGNFSLRFPVFKYIKEDR